MGIAPRIGGVVALVAALVIVLLQVDVGSPSSEAERTCGSAFDTMVGRAGWEDWWVGDLDDPDPIVREELLRTTECPGATNVRTAAAAVLAVLGVAGLWVSRRGGDDPSDERSDEPVDGAHGLRRLGRATTIAGGVLTLAGVVSIVVLVADPESTLFLYIDRLVVGVIGLIVLVPAVSLLVLGRALTVVGDRRPSATADLDA